MDIRQKVVPFEFDGKVFHLTCNMNVLADVQEHFGGTLQKALNNAASLNTLLVFLSAMLNDHAEDKGWDERYTPKQVGRKLPPTKQKMDEIKDLIMGLVVSALAVDTATSNNESQEEPSKN